MAEPKLKKMTVSETDVAVDISNMNKWYGDFHVLRDINLQRHARRAHRHLPARRAPASRR